MPIYYRNIIIDFRIFVVKLPRLELFNIPFSAKLGAFSAKFPKIHPICNDGNHVPCIDIQNFMKIHPKRQANIYHIYGYQYNTE